MAAMVSTFNLFQSVLISTVMDESKMSTEAHLHGDFGAFSSSLTSADPVISLNEPETSRTVTSPIFERLLQGEAPITTYDGTSQYSQGGVSACALASLNTIRYVFDLERKGLKGLDLLEEILTRETIEAVTQICSTWTSSGHTEVDDVLNLPLFRQSLDVVSTEYDRVAFDAFRGLLHDMGADEVNAHCQAAVITRSPEIIAIFSIPTFNPALSTIWVLFDSHTRPRHPNGSAFICFPSVGAAALYLKKLFKVDSSVIHDMDGQWQTQLLTHYSAHRLAGKAFDETSFPDVLSTYEFNIGLLQNQLRFREAETAQAEAAQEISRLKAENLRLETERQMAVTSARRARAELEELRSLLGMDNSVTLSSILPPGSAFEFGGDKGKGKERAHHPSHGASSSPDHNIPQPTRGKVGPILKEFRAYLDAQFTEPARHHGSLGPHHDSGAKTDAEKSFDLAVALQGEYESENARIIAQQEILLQSYQGKFECGICLETCPDDSATSIDQCQHKCCRDCIRGYLVSKIEEHRFPVVCPICSANENQRDPGIIGEEIAVQIGLTQEQYQLWNELGVAVFSTVINCPKCEKSLVVDRDDYQANEIISCPLPGCRGHWCKKCSQITNPQQRHTCDGSAELDRLIDQQKWKRCPGCNTPTEKASGCNHMTCTSAGCNTHFCYLCGNLIVRSVLRDDIQRGVSAHYSTNCALFAH